MGTYNIGYGSSYGVFGPPGATNTSQFAAPPSALPTPP
jgi:hypothetical protein